MTNPGAHLRIEDSVPAKAGLSLTALLTTNLGDIPLLGRGKVRDLYAIDDALLREMMALAAGEAVPDDYIAMMREDLTDDNLASRSLKWRRPPRLQDW